MKAIICIFSLLSFLMIGCKTIPSNQQEFGTLSIRAFSDSIKDPVSITPEDEINALLDVVFPDGTKKTIVTDELGFYRFNNAPLGEYSILPRYFDSRHTIRVNVSKNIENDVVIRIPTVGIYFYIVNSNLLPLDDLDARVALAHSIDRNLLVNKYNVATGPAYNMIPLNMSGLWSARAKKYLEIENIENPFLYFDEQQTIIILYNITELNQSIADDIGTNWTNLFNVSKKCISISYDSQDWDSYLRKRDALNEYHVSRAAWILESNNMLTFYRSMTYISNTNFLELVKEAERALLDYNFEKYDSIIIDINNFLIEKAIIIPIFNY